jgi:dienelactone hydrolase
MTTFATATEIEVAGVRLGADLVIPDGAIGVVLFAHGSGSSRHSPRNRAVADALHGRRLATVLVDLLTPAEERQDAHTGHLRFDIGLLADRLVGVVDWLSTEPTTARLPIGLFGASTGAAAALAAAAARPDPVAAVVSRGGRPDLAGAALADVAAPTLLLVGGRDTQVIELNQQARAAMTAEVQLRVVAGAGHLFEEPGALREVAVAAGDWFADRLPGPATGRGPEIG